MRWILISLVLCWLIYREFRNHRVVREGYDTPDLTPVFKPYVAGLAVLAAASAWPPYHYWRIEHYLSAKATELADAHRAHVHCNTVFDTFFDSNSLAAGHANPETGQIVLQYPWCERLMAYVAHPDPADWEGRTSLNILTHESMHVRGEYNEAVTECESVQRNYRTARLLGVADGPARRTAVAYYQIDYLQKGAVGGMQAPYFSTECAPGRSLDEHLADSTWALRATK